MEYRTENKKKSSFNDKKRCVLKSLQEVNCFLSKLTCNVGKACAIKKIIK